MTWNANQNNEYSSAQFEAQTAILKKIAEVAPKAAGASGGEMVRNLAEALRALRGGAPA